MIMECTERYPSIRLCQYPDKIKCTNHPINGSKYCSKHIPQSAVYHRGSPQTKTKTTNNTDSKAFCSSSAPSKASRKRRRTEAPVHKDLVNKTPPLALHAFQIITQERQRLKFKPHIYKRPLEHLKWVIKKERLSKNPIYPSGMEADCEQYDTPHTYTCLGPPLLIEDAKMCDATERSIFLAEMEQQLQQRLDSLVCEVKSFKRLHIGHTVKTKATVEAARANVTKTTHLLRGVTPDSDVCSCELPNKATKYICCVCSKRAIPLSKYCRVHILKDPKQLLFSRCNAQTQVDTCPAPSALSRHCYLHSLLQRYGVAESQDIETESSSSESETEDSVFEPSFQTSPFNSPRPPPKKRLSSPPFPNPTEQSLENQDDIDMLPIQPDTVLDMKNNQWFDAVPEEADIPLSVGCLEPNPLPQPMKRIMMKDEEVHARAIMNYPYNTGGYFYSPYIPPSQTSQVFIHSYTKEGEPIYGSYNHEFKPYYSAAPPDSRCPTPGEMPLHGHHQPYFHARPITPMYPGPNPPAPIQNKPSPKPKRRTPNKKKKDAQLANKNAEAFDDDKVNQAILQNPHSQNNRSESPNSVASPSTMAALKFKISDNKREDQLPEPKEIEEESKMKKINVKEIKKSNVKSTAKQAPQGSNIRPIGHQNLGASNNIIRPPMQQPHPKVAPNHIKGVPTEKHQIMSQMPGMMYGRQMMEQSMQMPGGYINPYQGHAMYNNQHVMTPAQQPYYMHPMYMAQHQNNMMSQPVPHQAPSPSPAGGVASPVQITRTPAATENKEKPENANNELSDYQKFALQQRQRQMMIAQSHISAQYNSGYPVHNHYQYQMNTTPNSPKPEKKKKVTNKESKVKEDLVPKAPASKPRSAINSPSNKELSSLQSLMTTASSAINKIDGLHDDNLTSNSTSTAMQTDNKSRSGKSNQKTKKSTKLEEKDEMLEPGQIPNSYPCNTQNTMSHPSYYPMAAPTPYPGHMIMPMKNYFYNGNPLYFKMQEQQDADLHEKRQIVVNDAVLSRNRPSTHLMKNPQWVDKYMSGKKSDEKTKGGNKTKLNTPRDRKSPQKRNLIFHNTELPLYADKIAKQQRDRSHKTGCSNKKKSEDKDLTQHNLAVSNQVLIQNDSLKLGAQQGSIHAMSNAANCSELSNKLTNNSTPKTMQSDSAVT